MKNSKTLTLVEGAVMVALATVLSFIRVYKLPWGGSITLLSMLPIAVFSIKHGVAKVLERHLFSLSFSSFRVSQTDFSAGDFLL